jgi:hypothetical protein
MKRAGSLLSGGFSVLFLPQLHKGLYHNGVSDTTAADMDDFKTPPASKLVGRDRDMGDNWIQGATAKMKKKGTLGSFGKATPSKIKAAKAKGGKMEKKAVFAESMKKIAQKRG